MKYDNLREVATAENTQHWPYLTGLDPLRK